MRQVAPIDREPGTGMSPHPLDGMSWDQFAVREAIGTLEERQAISKAHGYEIDAVLAASAEFRRAVGGAPLRWMSRGEALHIARALAAVASDVCTCGTGARDADGNWDKLEDPGCPRCGDGTSQPAESEKEH